MSANPKPVIGLLRAVALGVALITLVSVPSGYFALTYFGRADQLSFKAQLSAGRVASYAYVHGPMWPYHRVRVRELISFPEDGAGPVVTRITDGSGALIDSVGEALQWPVMSRSADVQVSGEVAGRIIVESSLRPILYNTAAAAGLSLVLALLAYLSIRVFPLRILARTLDQLEIAHGESGFQMREKQLAYEELQRQHQIVEQTAQELARARDDAVLANRTKSEFLTHMSHELRTPLNAIIGFSQILKDELFGAVGNARYREYGKDIYESGNHLLQVINDILDLSKIEAGKLELRREDVDIPRLLAACLRLVRERARDASVRLIDATAADQELVVAADETRIKQVVINLLSNAIKFTPAGGEVTVAARWRADGAVEIAVADTGIGMKPEDIPIAMQPFRQIENPMNRKFAGTGIGLPLTKALVEAHDGELTLESAAGVGTTVTIALPAGTEPQVRFAALVDQPLPRPAPDQDLLPSPSEPIRLRVRR